MFLRMSAAAAPPAPGSRSRERACPPWAARRGRTAPHSSGTDTRGETEACNMLLIAMVCRTKYSFYFIKQNTCILPDCDSPCLGIIVFVMEEKQIRILFTLFDVSPLGRAGVSGPAPGHLHTGIVTTSEHRGITAEYNPILLFTATL